MKPRLNYKSAVDLVDSHDPFVEEALKTKMPKEMSTLELQKLLASNLPISKEIHLTAIKHHALSRKAATELKLSVVSLNLGLHYSTVKNEIRVFLTTLSEYVRLSIKNWYFNLKEKL